MYFNHKFCYSHNNLSAIWVICTKTSFNSVNVPAFHGLVVQIGMISSAKLMVIMEGFWQLHDAAHPALTHPSLDFEHLMVECRTAAKVQRASTSKLDFCQMIIGAIKLPYSQMLQQMLSLHMIFDRPCTSLLTMQVMLISELLRGATQQVGDLSQQSSLSGTLLLTANITLESWMNPWWFFCPRCSTERKKYFEHLWLSFSSCFQQPTCC